MAFMTSPTPATGTGPAIKFVPKGTSPLPRALMLLSVIIILAILAVILIDVMIGGLGTISWEFLSSPPSQGMEAGGIFPAIFGTMLLVILMVIAVVPIGVLTAVYLQEYTNPQSRLTRVLRAAINNLAGIPSIVFGLFGLGFFVGFVGGGLDKLFHPDSRPVWGQPAIIWASLTMALLTLPVVIVSTEEALRAIPRELKEASYALGATKLQTIIRIVIPQALPGIFTGAILAVSRGAGEVAPIMFTGAAYYLSHLPSSLHDQFMVLGYHVYVLATQSPNIDATLPLLYGTVLVLLALTFALNLVAILIRARIRARRISA
jgi:phosphate transport system permease protein